MNKPNSIVALIVAAGTGSRLGRGAPKQYRILNGKPILRHSLDKFLASGLFTEIRVVIHPSHKDFYDRAIQGLDLKPPVLGGDIRQQSVRLGLEALQDNAPDYVFIHDAARPFADEAIFNRVLEELSPQRGVIAAIPVTDTLKSVQDEMITQTIDRSRLWAMQTPQAFPYEAILKAHQQFKDLNATDDAMLAEKSGLEVKIALGSSRNFKITTQDDFAMAEKMLASHYEYRTGQGFDVHRFQDGDHVTLGGIKIPFSKGIEAHSDGDVILHALTDALLGTIGAGDIGQHFPPSDPQWKNADSGRFVRHAVQLLADKKAEIINADMTFLGEAPKLSPYRAVIQGNIAALLKIDETRINIKATTTEKLGFTGRSEGLAAQAVVTIRIMTDV